MESPKITKKDFEGIEVTVDIGENYKFCNEPQEPDYLLDILKNNLEKIESISFTIISFNTKSKDKDYYIEYLKPFNEKKKEKILNSLLKVLKIINTNLNHTIAGISVSLKEDYSIEGKHLLYFLLEKSSD